MERDVASSGQEDTDMPALIQKTRHAAACAVALPAPSSRRAGLSPAWYWRRC